MDELLNSVRDKTGLSMDQARSAVNAVLGYVRGKLPASIARQFDSALTGLGQSEPVGDAVPDMGALAEKTGLAGGQAGAFVETVMAFLKEKLPPDLADKVTGALSTGVLAGLGQKVAGLFGRG